MLDIKLLRTNPEKVRKAMSDRGGAALPALETLIARDEAYRAVMAEVEKLRARRNEISAGIAAIRKEKGPDAVKEVMAEANKIKEEMQAREGGLSEAKKEIDALVLSLPNLPHESVSIGKNEADNKVVRENASSKKEFSFKPADHHTIGEKLGILDFETATLLSGARFALMKGAGARLERALINFMLDMHTRKHGYTEVIPPYIVTAETLTGTGQLPKFEEDLYRVSGEHPAYLIPTAEVPLTNMFRGKILKESDLPLKFTAYTACFRQEAGSYGKDTRGLIRNHQFNKVELVWITKPEESMAALETLASDAAEILSALELPHRVISLCTGDMGFSSCKTYDLEVWLPSEGRYREISSCSNCWDFQGRRMNTRIKREKGMEFVHSLNGSGLAVGRTFAAILENFQNADGSVSVPDALRPFFGAEVIKAA